MPSPDHKTSANRAARGFAWLTVQNIATRAFALISQLLLAKILMPSDFGTFGLSTTVTALTVSLSGLGIEQVIQNRQKNLRLWATQAIILGFLASSAAAILMLPLGTLASVLFKNKDVASLVGLSALALPISALSLVPQVEMQRRGDFRFLALYGGGENLATQGLMIAFAAMGCGPYSFALPLPIVATIRTVVFWLKHPIKLLCIRRARGWRPLLARSSASLGWKLAAAAIDQGDYATLGMFVNKASVGAYTFAFRVTAQPARMLASNTVSVLIPSLIRLRGNPNEQESLTILAVESLGYISCFICGLQATLCAPGFHIFFGHKWDDAVLPLKLLSLSIPMDAMSLPAAALLDARGLFRAGFRFQLLCVPLFYIAVLIGVAINGMIGVATAVAIFYTAKGFSFLIYAYRGRAGAILQALSVCGRPVFSGALALGVAMAASGAATSEWSVIIIRAFVDTLSFVAVVCFMSPHLVIRLRKMLTSKWHRTHLS